MPSLVTPFGAASLALFTSALLGQSPAPTSYSVASIKPNKSADNRFMMRPLPDGGLTATGVTLKMLVTYAYNVQAYQVSGGPNWMNSDRWDVEARTEGDPQTVSREQSAALLRGMLEDRFQVKVHREAKQMPTYALVVAPSGPKLKEPTEDPADTRPLARFGFGSGRFVNSSMGSLAYQLSSELGRSVANRTGLNGRYDFELKWTPAPGDGGLEALGLPPQVDAPAAADSSAPTIFTALQEQLGLKLESTRGPVDVLTVQRAERPSEN